MSFKIGAMTFLRGELTSGIRVAKGSDEPFALP